VLGAHVSLGGVVGSDEAGRQLLVDCRSAGIDVRAVMQIDGRRTTRKLRVLGRGQQLIRLDWEDARSCENTVTEQLQRALESGARPDVIILSDYAKGVLTDAAIGRLTATGRAAGCRILVDPKRRDLNSYRGASILTPNLGELALAAGFGSLNPDDLGAVAAAARPLVYSTGLESMVVTLGDRGMLIVDASGDTHHVPAVRRAVSDVTGAGDTAVAVMAAAIAAGGNLRQAATIANVAAGLAVAEVGAVAIEPHRIRLALEDVHGGKVLSRAELAARVAGWRVMGKKIVFTNGCFDLLHAGHLSLLHQAAALGDVLVLAINSDESIQRLKGPNRPIVSASDRAALLAALSCVDAVTIFNEDTPLETLRVVRPNVLVKGEDYGIDKVVGRELVEADGGRVALVPLLSEKSTTALVERIRRNPGADPH
jgi:D-beta-D-heptose 7-phosphate kinase/D-beta-D-heptose 1-phosphate adenosyltransferase